MSSHLFLRFATAFILVLSAAGCATLQKGSHQRVPIESEPPGAQVYINHEPAGETPMYAVLSRRSGHMVEIRKDGFDTQRVDVRPVPNRRDGAFIQFSSDDYTGALNDLRPSRVWVGMRPRILPAAAGSDPAGEKEAKLEEARALRDAGRYSEGDYEYVVRRIEEFYGRSR